MAASDEYYTCSMDPPVMDNISGNCPICHMDMIKAKRNQLKKGQIRLSTQQIKLANITWDTIQVKTISKEILLTGKIGVDQTMAEAISAKVKGRIEKLRVKNVGDFIHKGEILYELYSEDLNVAQQEYILALSKGKNTGSDISEFAKAAKNKMLLYGMQESQIKAIADSGRVLNTVPFFAHSDGFVSDLFIAEGSYVDAGTMLFHLSSLNTLWVEARVYLPYLPYLKVGTEGHFSIPAAGEKQYSGKVIFIDPQVQAPNRFVMARFQISNVSENIKPGMMATLILQTDKKEALTLPLDAVIQDSKGATVWVRTPDCLFESRMVSTGIQNSRRIEITGGLIPGDLVVGTGAYLLNSEYIFKNGANPMEGHRMQSMPGMNM